MASLEPTRFHRELLATLAAEEPGLLAWFSSDRYETEHADAMKLELLRSSYRLAPESHQRPHRLAAEAARALGVEVPISIYQLAESGTRNAVLFFATDAAHVALAGPLLESLDDDELRALFGHELAHHWLWTREGGIHRAVATLVEHAAARGSAPYAETAMRARLWTEILCDRGAMIAASSDAAIRCLVKVGTGLSSISANDYLAQAREVVSKLDLEDRARSTHPEHAIRGLALALWAERGDAAEAEIAPLIEGRLVLESLDIIRRKEASALTRAWIDQLLEPEWMRTEVVLAHARAFFPDATWPAPARVAPAELPRGLAEYCAYVLLDFAVIDPALEEVALARALIVARALGVRDVFVSVVRKELKQTLSALEKLEQRAESLFTRASEALTEAAPS